MHKFFLTLGQVDPEMDTVVPERLGTGECSVPFKDVTPSRLPSFLLPCPHCGHRMAIMAVTPARFAGAESNDLEDITHGCVQCGTTLTRTVRSLASEEHETALRV
jgi:DNA-directed RNA polymerase subunit RPC12/RpoP